MATVHRLVTRSELVRLGGGLEQWERPEREMYAFPHVIHWFDEVLPSLRPELSESRKHELAHGVQSPIEQLDDFIHDFVSGEDLDVYEKAHSMRPDDLGIWELKTVDVRLFGWFYRRGVFVVANADSAFRCKKHGLYGPYRDDARKRREALDLDPPKFVSGGYSYVL